MRLFCQNCSGLPSFFFFLVTVVAIMLLHPFQKSMSHLILIYFFIFSVSCEFGRRSCLFALFYSYLVLCQLVCLLGWATSVHLYPFSGLISHRLMKNTHSLFCLAVSSQIRKMFNYCFYLHILTWKTSSKQNHCW